MASNVTSKICSSVKRAGVYSVLADETKDCSKVEQLSIVIRYVDMNTAKIHEHFLTYVKAEFLDAEALSSLILKVLDDNGLDPSGMFHRGMMVLLS